MRLVRDLAAAALVAGLAGGCSSSRYEPGGRSRMGDVVAVPPPPVPADGESADLVSGPTTRAAAWTDAVEVRRPEPVRLPIRVGVVDVDDFAPATAVLDRLRARPDLFAAVEPVATESRAGDRNSFDHDHDHDHDHDRPADPLAAARRVAGGAGLDYLLVYGRSVDFDRTVTPLQVFNWSIIGAWLVPSEQLTSTGRATAALVDVRTGRFAWTTTAEASDGTFLPTVSSRSADESLKRAVAARLDRELTSKAIARTAADLAPGR